MKKLLVSAAIAASLVAPSVADAQALPATVAAVVDLDKVTNDCNACKTATSSLRSQVSTLQGRGKALAAPLDTEQKAIQAAIDAQKGSPDAALQARIKAFEARRQQGAAEIEKQQQQIQRNQQYVQQQIQAKLGPIYQQVMVKRGANVLLETGATLATVTSVDVTNDVLAALNAVLPSISTTAPAAAAAPAQPQGR